MSQAPLVPTFTDVSEPIGDGTNRVRRYVHESGSRPETGLIIAERVLPADTHTLVPEQGERVH